MWTGSCRCNYTVGLGPRDPWSNCWSQRLIWLGAPVNAILVYETFLRLCCESACYIPVELSLSPVLFCLSSQYSEVQPQPELVGQMLLVVRNELNWTGKINQTEKTEFRLLIQIRWLRSRSHNHHSLIDSCAGKLSKVYLDLSVVSSHRHSVYLLWSVWQTHLLRQRSIKRSWYLELRLSVHSFGRNRWILDVQKTSTLFSKVR